MQIISRSSVDAIENGIADVSDPMPKECVDRAVKIGTTG